MSKTADNAVMETVDPGFLSIQPDADPNINLGSIVIVYMFGTVGSMIK